MIDAKQYIDELIHDTAFSYLITEVSDEEFAQVYPKVKDNIEEIFRNSDVQKSALMAASTYDDIDPKVQQEVYDSLMEEINNLTYCDEKKDFLTAMISNSFKITAEMKSNPRERIYVKIIKLNPNATLPEYAHPTDAGADICAIEETRLEAGETKIVKTGLAVAIPAGYEIQVRPRSGLSLKSGLRIANSVGTIDSDYRGEIGVIMTNTNDIPYIIDKGTKIAQLIIAPSPMIKWQEVNSVEELGLTERDKGGFGSTDAS